MLKLTDLRPRWVSVGGEGVTRNGEPVPERDRIGVSFDCPCAECTAARPAAGHDGFFLRVSVCFSNPVDGGPAVEGGGPTWTREGDTFETLRLSPSIQRHRVGEGGCNWHGFVGQNGAGPGEVVSC